MKKLTQEEFILKSIKSNPDINFTNSVYINSRTKVYTECHKHGSFSYFPKAFLNGTECPECAREERLRVFIEKAKKIHKNKYIYDNIYYTIQYYLDLVNKINEIIS